MDTVHCRLDRDCWFYTPCLGWTQFGPDDVRPFRTGTAPSVSENDTIPAFMAMVLDQTQHGVSWTELE